MTVAEPKAETPGDAGRSSAGLPEAEGDGCDLSVKKDRRSDHRRTFFATVPSIPVVLPEAPLGTGLRLGLGSWLHRKEHAALTTPGISAGSWCVAALPAACVHLQVAPRAASLCGRLSPTWGREAQILVPAPLLTSCGAWSKFLPPLSLSFLPVRLDFRKPRPLMR